MEYKEKYKNVMEVLKKAASDPECEDERFCCVVYDLFPELKESDDEKVRKALIEFVHDSTRDELWAYHISEEEAIAWFEKQGEQKPAWSEDDEKRLQSCINILKAKSLMGKVDTANTMWLKSLK